jgi:uncharacterized protein
LAKLRRIVLDVLKPHSPNLVDMATQLADLEGIDGVDISLVEMDQKVENVKITCEGEAIDFEQVERIVIQNGASIHSVDKVSAGTSMIVEATTQQD